VRTVIFGIDGLTYRILHPMIARGDLPNFKKVSEQGCEAILESKYPPLTPPAWISLSTGLKPAAHGVYDFWSYEEQQERGAARKSRVQTHRKGGKAIWNILSEYGKQVVVINIPSTFPPDAVNGVMVSGYMTPSTKVDFTYPASFKGELDRVVPDYEIDLDTYTYERMKVSGKVGPLVDATLRMTEKRIKLLMHLLEERSWDFCYIAFIGSDRLQHPIWEEITALEPQATEYYRLLDDALGRVLEQLGPDDTLFIVSDHGFQGHSTYFDINEYLYSKELLVMDQGFEAQRRKASRANKLRHVASQVGLRSIARKVKRSLKTANLWAQPASDEGLDRPVLDDVDWERTMAYVPSFSGFQGGYADIFLSPEMSAEQQAGLCEDLKRQIHPRTGKPFIDAIYTTEVFGSGPYAPTEAHLLLLPTEGVTFRVSLGNERLWDDLGKSFGSHQKDGVLYAYGGGIKKGFKAPNAEIYDLVPTVLSSMGLPLPYEFDGRVLEELFVETKQAEGVPKASGATEDGAGGGLARRKLKKLLEA
jgi:predicted AlkP superfamily phosphohydrolase/phosphomutase